MTFICRFILRVFCFALLVGGPLSSEAATLDFTVNASENVTVDTTGGVPRLQLDVGGVTRFANYVSGSGTSALRFSYITQAGDVDLDGIAVTLDLDPHGGTLTDGQGNSMTTFSFPAPATSQVKIDHPSLSVNFITNDFILNDTHYNSFASFLTAAGGSFSRSSSAAYYDASGVMQTAGSNVIRLDHDPVTHVAKGILVEEARGNSFLRSAEFDNAYWTKAESTVSANNITAPDGTSSADKIVESSNTAVHEVTRSGFAISANTVSTVSVYAKAGERSILRLYSANSDGVHSVAVNFNLSTGTVGSSVITGTGVVDAVSIQAIGNGWYRCASSFRLSGDITNRLHFIMRTADGTGTSSYAGNGTSGLYVWGAQLETGSNFPTSYIPTTNAAGSRQADNISIPTGSWYNSTLSTVSGEYSSFAPAAYSTRLFSLNDNAVGQSEFLIADAQTGNVIAQKKLLNVPTNTSGPVYVPGTIYKVAAATNVSVTPLAVIGASYSNTAAGGLTGITQLNIGSGKNLNFLNGWVRRLHYYPAFVQTSQLQLLAP